MTGIIKVGDIVKPGIKKNSSRWDNKYQSLCYQSKYIVTSVVERQGKHDLIQLKVHEKGTGHASYHDGDSGAVYDSRNFIRLLDAAGNAATAVSTVKTSGTIKEDAVWIIVNSKTGTIVDSVAIVPAEDSDASLNGYDPVKETAIHISKIHSAPLGGYTTGLKTEEKVDTIIANLLRKDPEGEYAAFKLNKIGKLPVLPVVWTKHSL